MLDEAALRPAHVRLSLQPGVFVEGRVVDDAGKALADATVDVMAMPSDDLPVSGHSGPDGSFRLGPIAPGKHQVLARLEDHVLLDAPEPQLGARSRESFELRLARTARVDGRVLDEAGRPMVGVSVTSICLIGGRDDLVVIPGALPLRRRGRRAAGGPPAAPRRRSLERHGRRGAFVSPACRQAGPASRSSAPTSCPSGASPCCWSPAMSATWAT